MLKKILGTIGTRYAVAALSLALIFINARILGAEGTGTIGLIIVSVNIAAVVSGILSGNTLVYFMNKYPVNSLLIPAYGWAFAGSGIACGIMDLAGVLPCGYGLDIFLLAVINSLITANSRFLLGKEHIKGFNLIHALQGGLLFFVLLAVYFILGCKDVRGYLSGMYITCFIALAGSFMLLRPIVNKEENDILAPGQPIGRLMHEMFAYGLWASVDNLAEALTTRINHFLLQNFAGLSGVGILDAGTRMSESVWHISRSAAFITYEEVAKSNDRNRQKTITLRLFKFTFVLLALVMFCILLIPEQVYTHYLFTEEFTGIRTVVTALAPGIIAFGCNNVIAHYFIGSGRVKVCTAASCLGLAVLLLSGYLLIPQEGVTGAAISCSIAYGTMTVFYLAVFCRSTRSGITGFLPDKTDWNYLRSRFLSKKHK